MTPKHEINIPNAGVLMLVLDRYFSASPEVRDDTDHYLDLRDFSWSDAVQDCEMPESMARESFETAQMYVTLVERSEVHDGRIVYPCLDRQEDHHAAYVGFHCWLYLCGWTADEFFDELLRRS